MGRKIILAIEDFMLALESRMANALVWVCWACGISSDDVERVREAQKKTGRTVVMPTNPHHPPQPKIRHSDDMS
ncbi:MAG: hypothetical protein VCD33_09960 [Alphaproteobacteria bacterium]|jgi:hypothetical protein